VKYRLKADVKYSAAAECDDYFFQLEETGRERNWPVIRRMVC
jgi:hypothetical protein